MAKPSGLSPGMAFQKHPPTTKTKKGATASGDPNGYGIPSPYGNVMVYRFVF